MDFGIVSYGTIMALVYVAALGLKASKLDNKWIPVCCGGIGAGLGIVAMLTGVPDFPAEDLLTAAAVGAFSGLSATGVNQVYKQLKK